MQIFGCGLYGRGTLDKLGKVGLDTRNPYIAGALEIIIDSENRYSGIPTMRRETERCGLRAPVFESHKGIFKVTFYNEPMPKKQLTTENILAFCTIPRSRAELLQEFRFESQGYFMKTFIHPLLEDGLLRMTIPDKPKSKNQRYIASE